MTRYELISNLIKDIKNPVGAEIGVCTGEFSIYMIENNKTLKLFCVDPYKMYQQYYTAKGTGARQHGFTNQKQFDVQYGEMKSKFNLYGDRIILIRENSINADKFVEDGSLDFVFIDANHLYSFVKDDIAIWTKKVKLGGIISGHDYNEKDPCHLVNTCKAVNETFGKEDLNFGPDSCWWCIK